MYILLGGEKIGVGQNLVWCGVKVRRGRIWVGGVGVRGLLLSFWRSAVTVPWSSGDGNSPCMGGGGQRSSSDSSPSRRPKALKRKVGSPPSSDLGGGRGKGFSNSSGASLSAQGNGSGQE